MATATQNIDMIRKLRREAISLRGATANWRAKYSDTKHYDKQNFAFAPNDGRGLNAFSFNLAFEAYTGTYGSSSVGRSWSVDDEIVKRFFVKALNRHKQTIFDTMAELAEAEAASLLDAARTELDALNALLAEAGSPQPVEVDA